MRNLVPLLRGTKRFVQTRTTLTGDHGYVVLLPEVPLDTSSTNSLLASTDLPDFDKLTKFQCRNAMVKLSLELEARVWDLEVELGATPTKTMSQILALEKSSAQFDYVWSFVKLLSLVRTDFVSPEGYASLHQRGRVARSKQFCSVPIYLACRELTSSPTLSPPQRRLLSKYLLESKLSGIELTGSDKDHFTEILRKLEDFKLKYKINVRIATEKFRHLIVDPKYMGDMPPGDLGRVAKESTQPGKPPWVISLHEPIYKSFLEYCPERALRWNTWAAYNNRAAGELNKELNNSVNIEEIRGMRKQQANLLGYGNYVELSMATKMAGNVENVKGMIATLLEGASPHQEAELNSLQSFAASRGFDHTLAPWDIFYWRRKEKKSLFGTTPPTYFPYPHVLQVLFNLCTSLFSIEFEQVEFKTWHPDVSFYKVKENGEVIGTFCLDPYRRPTKSPTPAAAFFGTRSRCDQLGQAPHATLVFNYNPPIYGRPSLLEFEDVRILFGKFGPLLQHILTQIPYVEVGGTNNIEWDAVGVAEKFMIGWTTHFPTLATLATHQETPPLPPGEIENLIKSTLHFAAFDLCRELYLSALDIEFHSCDDFWRTIMTSLHPKYCPLDLQKQDAHPCSFTQIMSGQFAAAYYSDVWARMVAADVIGAWGDDAPDGDLGGRFRSTFLSLGGGHHPAEVFRRFRGRDPSPSAFLQSLGLTQVQV